ncbi:MAG TPA: hypothetical protein VGL94_12220 [Ktedonobacteraceae bacterium]|jgi:hypothetical protein
MKTLTAHTLENVFDLRTLSVSEKAIDAIELTDEELGRATGSCFGGFGGWGGGFGGWGCGCFIPICCDFCDFGGWGGGFGGFGGGWGW